jgi:LmbE family N-acetylglucosaminyl deacetylase
VAQLLESIPQRVLAIYAHPDDADVACGASLARWAKAGAEVSIVIVAAGDKGTIDAGLDPRVLAQRRLTEVAEAAQHLGISEVVHLNIPDGELRDTNSLVETFVRLIRSHQPDLVLGHDPTAVFFGSVYVNHQDHRAAGWALLDAVAPACALPHYFPQAGMAHRVPMVLLSGTLDPDVFVDVADTIDAKVAAVSAHRSQLRDDDGWVVETVRKRASEDGRRCGLSAAEGFRFLSLDG